MPRKNVAVLISGRGSNLQALIDAAVKPEYPATVALVLSDRKEAHGLKRAQAAKITTEVIPRADFSSRGAFEAALHEACVKRSIELICLAGFMRVLSAAFVETWSGRIINIHPSLLPAYPGLNTHARALAAGEKTGGCTVHFVTPEIDAGPVILQAAVPILPGDTEETLAARVLEKEHAVYPEALRMLAEGAVRGMRALP